MDINLGIVRHLAMLIEGGPDPSEMCVCPPNYQKTILSKLEFEKKYYENKDIYSQNMSPKVIKFLEKIAYQNNQPDVGALFSNAYLYYKISSQKNCNLCFINKANVIYYPCRHQIICYSCYKKYSDNTTITLICDKCNKNVMLGIKSESFYS